MLPTLIERKCVFCPNSFKVVEASKQVACSKMCVHYNGKFSYRETFNYGRPEANEIKQPPHRVYGFKSRERFKWLKLHDEKLRKCEEVIL